MQSSPFKVMIIGAGAGGLCLAQGLKADGVAVEVFERDLTPSDRPQGYRLSIRGAGGAALKACLPSALFERLVENSARPSQGLTFLDHRAKRLLAVDFPPMDRLAAETERPISRIALRRVLLDGLDDIVRFGKRFTAFADAPAGGVTARFADGFSSTGDVLVGADGAGSPVRAQLLPHARRVETGVMIVSGKFSMRDGARADIPPAIWRGPTLILGPGGRFLFANGVEFGAAPDPEIPPEDRGGYVMWGFSARRETFAAFGDIEALGGEALRRAVLAQVDDWSPAIRAMVERADPATLVAFPARTSVPIPPWKTGHVTLLGDALHNMTPYQGVGANTALRDAAALRRALVAVSRRQQALIPALAAYERDMIDYGFRAVRGSLEQMERLHARSPLARAATRMFFRVADRIPPLKAAFLAG